MSTDGKKGNLGTRSKEKKESNSKHIRLKTPAF